MCRVDTGCCLLVVWACLVLGSGLWILTSVTTSSCAWFVLVRLWVLWGCVGIANPFSDSSKWFVAFIAGSHISRKTCISSPNFRKDRHALHIPKWKAHVFTGVPGCRRFGTVPFIVLFVRTTLVVCLAPNVAAASTNPANPKP